MDVEGARHSKESMCSIGLVEVLDGVVINEYYSLIQPPGNKYHYILTKIHGLSARDTKNSPTFKDIWNDIEPILKGNTIVCHNVVYDKACLLATMKFYGLNYKSLGIEHKWRCSYKLSKAKGFFPANLKALSHRFGISSAGHHNALADARMCAKVFLKISKA